MVRAAEPSCGNGITAAYWLNAEGDVVCSGVAGASRSRSRQKDSPRSRRMLVVSSDEQLQRRKERRARQGRGEEGGVRGARTCWWGQAGSRGGEGRTEARLWRLQGSGPEGEGGEGGKNGDSEWMPRTSSRDWLIQLVEKQEEAIEKEKKERKQ